MLRTISVDIYFLREFKGVLLIKIMNGRANYPLLRALVEQANRVVKASLHCWLADYSGKG